MRTNVTGQDQSQRQRLYCSPGPGILRLPERPGGPIGRGAPCVRRRPPRPSQRRAELGAQRRPGQRPRRGRRGPPVRLAAGHQAL